MVRQNMLPAVNEMKLNYPFSGFSPSKEWKCSEEFAEQDRVLCICSWDDRPGKSIIISVSVKNTSLTQQYFVQTPLCRLLSYDFIVSLKSVIKNSTRVKVNGAAVSTQQQFQIIIFFMWQSSRKFTPIVSGSILIHRLFASSVWYKTA